MPTSLSAKKRVKQNEEKRLHNKAISTAYKTQIKKVLEAVKKGDRENAVKELPEAMRKLDKAAKCRIIHPNKGARKKSQLAKQVNSLK